MSAGKLTASTISGLRVLVVPDIHVKPGEGHSDFDRLHALGKYILDEKPDVVIQMGDLGDFDSLAGWKGSRAVGGAGGGKSLENKRLAGDMGAWKAAQQAIKGPVDAANKRHLRSRRKDRIYSPRWIQLLGNHEERLDRVAEYIPQLEGLIGTHQLHEISRENGWECYDFLKVVEIGGADFSHYFETGVSRKPAGIKQILNKRHRSSIFVHTHAFGFDLQPVPGHGAISAVNGGHFKAHSGPFEWAGVVMLTDLANGCFNIQQVPQDAILEAHGVGDRAQELRVKRAQFYRDHDDVSSAFGEYQ